MTEIKKFQNVLDALDSILDQKKNDLERERGFSCYAPEHIQAWEEGIKEFEEAIEVLKKYTFIIG